MRPKDLDRAAQLDDALTRFDRNVRPLPGVAAPNRREAFIEQVVESLHRVAYPSAIQKRQLSDNQADPTKNVFDPLRAAIIQHKRGNVDEAFWMVFLFVHFGKHKKSKWRLLREVYGRRNSSERWGWSETKADPQAFREWLRENRKSLVGSFGNHRKYVSLDADSASGTGVAFETYVNWVGASHEELLSRARAEGGTDPRKLFEVLYRSMARQVASFGRMGAFDYLAMLGKLKFADLEPGSAYMQGATGPVGGAKQLFGVTTVSAAELDQWLIELDSFLKIGMQAMEDAICNWQKSPDRFRPFRG